MENIRKLYFFSTSNIVYWIHFASIIIFMVLEGITEVLWKLLYYVHDSLRMYYSYNFVKYIINNLDTSNFINQLITVWNSFIIIIYHIFGHHRLGSIYNVSTKVCSIMSKHVVITSSSLNLYVYDIISDDKNTYIQNRWIV